MDLGLCIQYKLFLSFISHSFLPLGSRDDGDMTMNLIDVDFDWHGGKAQVSRVTRSGFGANREY